MKIEDDTKALLIASLAGGLLSLLSVALVIGLILLLIRWII